MARIAGIDIEIHPSWLLILGFVAWSLSDTFFPDHYKSWSTFAYWAVGISSAVLLFVTVLIHEMAHALVARHRGLPVPRITLFIFGGMSHMSRQPATAGEEFQIAAAGPATSILIALVSAGLGFAFREMSEKAEAILFYLAFVNLALGIFNILPGFPLDGGRVLRSIAWKRSGSFRQATRVASSVGSCNGRRPRPSRMRPTSPPRMVFSSTCPGPAPISTWRAGLMVAGTAAPGGSGTRTKRCGAMVYVCWPAIGVAKLMVHRVGGGGVAAISTGARHVPSRTMQSFSKTSVAAAGCTVDSSPKCGIMKMESTAISVMPSTAKASIIIIIACARRGA